MNIVVAKSAGFCFGVKRAVVEAYKILDKNAGKNIDLSEVDTFKHIDVADIDSLLYKKIKKVLNNT